MKLDAYITDQRLPVLNELPSLRNDEEDEQTMLAMATHHLDGIQRDTDFPFTSASSATHSSLLQSAQVIAVELRSQQRETNLQRVTEQRSRPKPYDSPHPMQPGELVGNEPSTSKAHRRPRLKRSRTQTSNPSRARSMTHRERQSLINTLKKRGEQLVSSCVVELEPLSLSKSMAIDSIMCIWWDWLDKCHHRLDMLQDDPNYRHKDWDILQSLFIYFARLRGVYGAEWRLCQIAWEKRKPWVSRRSIGAVEINVEGDLDNGGDDGDILEV
jgi:hypothetical protein